MDQPGKGANPARGQLNRENNILLSPCVPKNLVSRDGWLRMTRMTGSDCAVMCNLINIHTYIHTYIHT